MATIMWTQAEVGSIDRSVLQITWAPVTSDSGNNDICTPLQLPQYTSKSVHVFGTFGSSTVVINGSNNGGVSFVPLDDPNGVAISISSENIEQISQNTQQVQPAISGGTLASVTIIMLCVMPNPMRT